MLTAEYFLPSATMIAQCSLTQATFKLGKPHSNSCPGHLGIARKGGGLDPCLDGLGHFFREEFAKIKWAFAWLEGGSKPLPGWFGAQHEFQWGFPNSHGCHNLRSKEVFRCLSKQLYSWVVVETLITTLPCNFLFSSKTQNHRLPQWIFGKLVQQFPHFFWS